MTPIVEDAIPVSWIKTHCRTLIEFAKSEAAVLRAEFILDMIDAWERAERER